MEETFSEMIVKAKPTDGSFFLRSIGIVLCLLSVGMIFLIPLLGIAGVFLFGFLTYKIVGWTSLEYEYSLYNGQLEIDAITGRKHRKNKVKVDLKSCMMIAREDSPKLLAVQNPTYQIKDYSRGFKNNRRYEAVISDGDFRQRIIFEPDEKMIEAIRKCAPDKLIIEEA